jgi:hypothetical protein
MNATGAAILVNPHPCGHIMYPYTDESLVGQAVCLYASAGLRDGESVILIMTREHCEPIMRRLRAEGVDTEQHERTGRLICVTTEDLLAQFIMADGTLNERQFKSTIGEFITRARANTLHGYLGKVRLFGEMVSQLRNTSLTATERMEELWSAVVSAYSVALLCTYALHNQNDHIPQSLIDLHSHNIEPACAVAH